MFNSTGLTLWQNLKPASSNTRVIHAIEDILKRHKGKKSERTIVGYCIIAIRGLVKDDASEKILTAAFRNDYFPTENFDKFSASIYRVLRAYSKKESKWACSYISGLVVGYMRIIIFTYDLPVRFVYKF